MVSIHAPARGATGGGRRRKRCPWFQSTLPRGERPTIDDAADGEDWFQSTLPRGERRDDLQKLRSDQGFQSTLPRGERRRQLRPDAAGYRFNPRSRAGSDPRRPDHDLCPSVSIHAPARGATIVCACAVAQAVFQSTLPRGERPGRKLAGLCRRGCFNPRSRAGSNMISTGRSFPILVFQSTLPRGERRSAMPVVARAILFQSTLPRGERHADLFPVVYA